jgi:hypothetical protein
MSDTLKNVGCILSLLFAVIAGFGLLALFVVGAEWLSQRLLPWFVLASLLATVILVIVLLPLAAIRRTRPFASVAILIVSYVLGVTVWMEGLLITMALWGWFAVAVGLFVAGIGVVPIAMVATLSKAMWRPFTELVTLTTLTFGTRLLALWVASKAETSLQPHQSN